MVVYTKYPEVVAWKERAGTDYHHLISKGQQLNRLQSKTDTKRFIQCPQFHDMPNFPRVIYPRIHSYLLLRIGFPAKKLYNNIKDCKIKDERKFMTDQFEGNTLQRSTAWKLLLSSFKFPEVVKNNLGFG